MSPKYQEGDLQEDDVVEIEYWINREGGDPHVKKVIGQVVQIQEDYFILGDIGQDVGPSILIHYDRVLGIEHLPQLNEVQTLIEKSWTMVANVPLDRVEATDQIIKLTQLLQMMTAGPVADQ